MSRRKSNRREKRLGISFPRRLILGWILSLFIPFLVLFLMFFLQYGNGVMKIISGDVDILQRHGYGSMEQIGRDINIWSMDNPVYQNHDDLNEKILTALEDGVVFEVFMIERKGEEAALFYPVSDELREDIETSFVGVEGIKFPEFGERELVSNETLFEATGFVMGSQIDLIYSDGQPGSIYIFYKITELPSMVFKFFLDNFMKLIVILIFVHVILSFAFTKKMTRPIEDLLRVMRRYQKQDFKPRLDADIREPMLRTINIAVNEMAEELAHRKEQDEIIEEQRVEFIAKISHDTKTPLASIKAHAEAFRDGMITDNEKRLKYTHNILNKVDIIDNMINELSLYSELANGIEEYNFQNLDLNYYLMDILEELQYDYPKDKLRINYEPCKDKKLMTKIDVTRFNRVLMNIVKNSVKYSDRDMTIIDVNVTCKDGKTVLSIKDNGKGMDTDKTDFIFESFTRGDASRDPNKGGSGLGLAIAKTIIEGHEGTIKAFTEKDKFFEIMIELPMEGRD